MEFVGCIQIHRIINNSVLFITLLNKQLGSQVYNSQTYPDHSPDPFPLGKPIEFSITVLNMGQDRAVRVYGAATPYFTDGKTPNDASYVASLFETAWQPKLIQQRLTDPKGRIIEPVRGDVKDEFGMHLNYSVTMTKELKQDILAEKKFMFLVGALRYEDSSGEHEFQFLRCLLPPFNDLKSWTAETIHEGTIDIPKNAEPVHAAQSSLEKPSATLSLIGPSNAPHIEVTNHGIGAMFHARVEMNGAVMESTRDVFAKWAHTDTVKTRIAKGETCRLKIAKLDWSYGRDTCQWKIIALRADHHIIEIPAIYSRAGLINGG